MPIVDADPERHAGFIMQSWMTGNGNPKSVLRELLNEGAARAAVCIGDIPDPVTGEDLIAGWAAVAGPQEIVWAYTKPSSRGRKVMKGILAYLGVDLSAPVVALYHSLAADVWIRRGRSITYKESE